MKSSDNISIMGGAAGLAAGGANPEPSEANSLLAPPTTEKGRLVELNGFGGDAAKLRMFAHLPQAAAGRPLVVLLHGCAQDAAVFAADTGWIDLADRLRFPLILPDQADVDMKGRCFDWYHETETARDAGEAASIETRGLTHSAPDVKQQLAAVRMLFDWLITGQVVPHNPAAAVRGPKHVVKTGKTPVLDAKEWRKLHDSIPTTTVRDLRDRALIATLTYSFARVTAALKMKVEDLVPKGAGWQLRLHEKGGKHHVMPCHHALAEAFRAYIDAAGIAEDRKGFLFRTSRGHTAAVLSEKSMTQPDAWRMIRRRAVAVGIHAPIGNHSFRATGITAYLSNGGALEHAQEMAGHESPRTTKLYDRTKERLTQQEVERIIL